MKINNTHDPKKLLDDCVLQSCPKCNKSNEGVKRNDIRVLYESSYSPDEYPMVWCADCGAKCVIIKNTAVFDESIGMIKCKLAKTLRIIGSDIQIVSPEKIPDEKFIKFLHFYSDSMSHETIDELIKEHIHPDAYEYIGYYDEKFEIESLFNVSLPTAGKYWDDISDELEMTLRKENAVLEVRHDGAYVYLQCLNEVTGEIFYTYYSGD
jgi:hypothetical protein